MHLPLQKVKKNIVWRRYQNWIIDIFSIYIYSSFFYLTSLATDIVQRISTSHTCLTWNVANFMTDEVRNFLGERC